MRARQPLPVRSPAAARRAACGSGCGPNIGGDAADIVRFTFFNWPRDPQPAQQRKMRLLVAHEMSHRFQLRDKVDAYPDSSSRTGSPWMRCSSLMRQAAKLC